MTEKRIRDKKTGLFVSKQVNGAVWELLQKYAEIGASQNKLAEVAGVSLNTLKSKCEKTHGMSLGSWIELNLLDSTESLLIGLRAQAHRGHVRSADILLKNGALLAAIRKALEKHRRDVHIYALGSEHLIPAPEVGKTSFGLPVNGRELPGTDVLKAASQSPGFTLLDDSDLARIQD